MSFWKWLYANVRGTNTPARIASKDFSNLPMKTHWNRLTTMFDLRMYYVLNSHNNNKTLQYTWELEKLHNELNYMHMRQMLKRFTYFFLASIVFFSMMEQPQYDWADNYELKHEFHTYIELEDGGDEGEDE
mmetsp:Transcript_56151/g.64436  ORF Transcript_56151/g.64436 Transcript_56151/m.64436 type:complete len:131 (+) Transcript_56151:56-448(+)